MTDTDPADRLLQAALAHVPFDGWSETTFRAACADCGIDPVLARARFPRGAVDLALAFHAAGDAEMLRRLDETDLGALRMRDRIATAIRLRIEATPDREAVRRGCTLFALPHHAPEGARAIWNTADLIWRRLGDDTRDFNWFTKRATLSAVYSATVLFWLGDDSPGHQATRDFLDRRIGEVMGIEKAKARMRDNPLARRLMEAPGRLAPCPPGPRPRT
ncbi:MAG: COQ9 family protein [Gemmobacter sp.]